MVYVYRDAYLINNGEKKESHFYLQKKNLFNLLLFMNKPKLILFCFYMNYWQNLLQNRAEYIDSKNRYFKLPTRREGVFLFDHPSAKDIKKIRLCLYWCCWLQSTSVIKKYFPLLVNIRKSFSFYFIIHL